MFTLGYATLAELGYKYVGADQLVGGTWPDNEPAVSCMDWQTGEVNAKYWVTNLLATTVGTKEEKTLMMSNVTATDTPVPKIGTTGTGTCGATSYGSTCAASSNGAYNSTTVGIKTLQECVAKVSRLSFEHYTNPNSA